jgi:transposase
VAEILDTKTDVCKGVFVMVKGTGHEPPTSSFSPELRLETLLEGLRGDKSLAEICRERHIKDAQYYEWREQFLTRVPPIFAPHHGQNVVEQAERIAELECEFGHLTMENDILEKPLVV